MEAPPCHLAPAPSVTPLWPGAACCLPVTSQPVGISTARAGSVHLLRHPHPRHTVPSVSSHWAESCHVAAQLQGSPGRVRGPCPADLAACDNAISGPVVTLALLTLPIRLGNGLDSGICEPEVTNVKQHLIHVLAKWAFVKKNNKVWSELNVTIFGQIYVI
ncbi:hCG1729649 [Homo sapiens]|jgi:hypothetical protein|nr:RecName: Full=Putative uncharacterized protein C8orf60 [Homo sapiens]EAW92221.1 hCG1729649 [Homo sapiens]